MEICVDEFFNKLFQLFFNEFTMKNNYGNVVDEFLINYFNYFSINLHLWNWLDSVSKHECT